VVVPLTPAQIKQANLAKFRKERAAQTKAQVAQKMTKEQKYAAAQTAETASVAAENQARSGDKAVRRTATTRAPSR
jgi:hypothetical protein